MVVVHEDSTIIQWFARVDGPVDVDLQLVRRALKACLNVETLTSPANGGRIYVPAAWQVGLKLIGCRAEA